METQLAWRLLGPSGKAHANSLILRISELLYLALKAMFDVMNMEGTKLPKEGTELRKALKELAVAYGTTEEEAWKIARRTLGGEKDGVDLEV